VNAIHESLESVRFHLFYSFHIQVDPSARVIDGTGIHGAFASASGAAKFSRFNRPATAAREAFSLVSFG